MSKHTSTVPLPNIKLTYDDYVCYPDDGKRHEIIDGDHYMTPAPKTKHQRVSRDLEEILSIFVKKHDLGEVFDAPCDVLLSNVDIVQPDLLFVSKENSGIITEKNIQGAPDIIVEIISPATERIDRSLKKDIYAKFGVKEYWIVDPDKETLEQYVLTSKGYNQIGTYGKMEEFSTDLIPGLVIELRKVF